MLEAVVFDFDGVVVDSEPLHLAAFRVFAERLGLSITQQAYDATYIGFDDRDAFRELLREAGRGVDESQVAAWTAEKADVFDRITRERASAGTLAIPGSVELIRALRHEGIPIAIGSGATRADIALMLGLIGCTDAFPIVVAADDVARSKPDPETYRRACAALGVAPERAVAIEDTPAGLASARAAGMATVAVATSFDAATLQPHADRVFTGPDQLTPELLLTPTPPTPTP